MPSMRRESFPQPSLRAEEGPLPAWIAGLAQEYDVVVRSVEIAGSLFEIAHPRSADTLIDDAEFAVDERLPYWADIWTSSIALARRIAAEQGSGRRLLELGCGVGLTSVAAAQAGFQVTATDYYEPALRFAALNAAHNGAPLTAAQILDWRRLPEDFLRFDVVIASDVLYERPNVELVAAVFARALRPGGVGLLTDPQRARAAEFPDACRRYNLEITRRDVVPVTSGGNAQKIDLFELRRPINAHYPNESEE
jgi:predicted nicotinamide N-methyase